MKYLLLIFLAFFAVAGIYLCTTGFYKFFVLVLQGESDQILHPILQYENSNKNFQRRTCAVLVRRSKQTVIRARALAMESAQLVRMRFVLKIMQMSRISMPLKLVSLIFHCIFGFVRTCVFHIQHYVLFFQISCANPERNSSSQMTAVVAFAALRGTRLNVLQVLVPTQQTEQAQRKVNTRLHLQSSANLLPAPNVSYFVTSGTLLVKTSPKALNNAYRPNRIEKDFLSSSTFG